MGMSTMSIMSTSMDTNITTNTGNTTIIITMKRVA